MAVWLCQCLCPQRHCILSLASDSMKPARLTHVMREEMAMILAFGVLNPWCGLCGAQSEAWTYETGRTRFATLEEAEPALRLAEAEQQRSRALLQELGLAVDQRPGAQN